MHFIKQQSNNIDCFENGWNLWLFSIVILRYSHQNASSLAQEHFADLQSSTEKQLHEKNTLKKNMTFSYQNKAPGASSLGPASQVVSVMAWPTAPVMASPVKAKAPMAERCVVRQIGCEHLRKSKTNRKQIENNCFPKQKVKRIEKD